MMPDALYADRREAGKDLASLLSGYSGRFDVVVLALPRGGVPVGYEIARALVAPLDVIIVRKLGVPGDEELAMGAIASGGLCVLNRDVIGSMSIDPTTVADVARREMEEIERRERAYRGERPPLELREKTIILVDDGLATGATMKAAIAAVRQLDPKTLVVAVPVGSPDVCDEIREQVDSVICPNTPRPFHGVGVWYAEFSQTTDEEVRRLLAAIPTRP